MAYMKSSDGIRLDSVPVALNPNDAGFDVYLLAGQSNMAGKALGFNASGPDPVHPRVYVFPQTGVFAGQIALAADPLGHPDASTGMGPGLPFARWQTLRTSSNRNILLVPTAWTGSGFSFDSVNSPRTWQVGNTSAGIFNLYENAISQVNAAIAAANAVGASARLAGVVWLQGEHDTSQGSYQTWLDALIDGFRTRFGIADLPFVVGQMVPEFIAANSGNQNTVHIDTPRRKTRTAFAYGIANAQNGDSLHYNVSGQRWMGRSMFDAFVRAKLNVTGTAPVAPSTISVVQYATQLVIAWDQTKGRATDFNVRYRQTGAGSWTTFTRSSPNLDANATITGLSAVTSYDIAVQTVNEQGVSAWTQITTSTVAAPAQVTGLVYSNLGITTATVAWTAVASALSYLIEKSIDGGTTWTTVSTVTTTSYNLTGLAANTATLVRVSGINNAGTGTPSSSASFTTLPAPVTLGVSGIASARAYSVARKIVSNYTGPLINVRRSSDNATQDIGFVSGTGDLDTSALSTFVGSNSAYVATLYDQSGNGRHLTQATTANQYRIVNAGTLSIKGANSKPALDGSVGSTHMFDSSPGAYAAGSATFLAVYASAGALGTSKWLVTETLSSDNYGQYLPITNDSSSSTTISRSMRNNSAQSFLSDRAATVTPAAFDTNQHVLTSVDSGSSFSQYVDGTIVGSATSYTRGSSISLDRFVLGCGIRLSGLVGNILGLPAELVVWYSALGGTDQSTAQANAKAYYGTP